MPTFDYPEMTHEQLAVLRERAAADPEMQRLLAPFEHQAFAREWTRESPWLAGMSLPAAIPAYQLAKLLGLGGEEATPASWEQLLRGYRGLGEGLGR